MSGSFEPDGPGWELDTSKLDTSKIKPTPTEDDRVPMPEEAGVRCLCRECYKTAFFLRVMVCTGDLFFANNMIKVDGTQPQVGEIIKCGSCGIPYAGGVQVEGVVS